LSVSLVVLAGGRGERLGGLVKPLLIRPDGRTLIDHLVRTLSPLAGETLIVAPPELVPLFAGDVVSDPGEGPGLALAAAARVARGERLLVVAGDHVSPSAELARMLLDAKETAAIAVEGVLQPTFAVVARESVVAMDPPPRSLRAALVAVKPHVIDARALPPALLDALADVDTEEDLRRWQLSTEGVPTWSHLAAREG
jgi:molybdopterin-guanine dinucleotide biosynthesis protein A